MRVAEGMFFSVQKDSYVCSINCIGSNGPANENPNSIFTIVSAREGKNMYYLTKQFFYRESQTYYIYLHSLNDLKGLT